MTSSADKVFTVVAASCEIPKIEKESVKSAKRNKDFIVFNFYTRRNLIVMVAFNGIECTIFLPTLIS
jgi:hypothetical protein